MRPVAARRARPRLAHAGGAAALLTLTLTACSSPDVVAPLDARADAPLDDLAADDAAPDRGAAEDAATPLDVAPGPDASAPDVAVGRDAAPVPDAPAPDAPRPPDVTSPPDAAAPPDVARAPDAAPDVPADIARAPDAACAGALAVTVSAPSANQEIETCSRTGAPVYFDFAASSAGASSVEFAFRTPDGALAPPAVAPDTSAPFTVRRQVGGAMTDMVPLATFGLRGAWHVEVTARDACGRVATARLPFALVYTNRMCPNP